jgi:Mce-associated membrane protein
VTAPESRRERIWLIAGAALGVLVAGLIVGFLVVSGNKTGTPPTGPQLTLTPSGASAAAPIGTTRDDSLRTAEEAAIALNTLDYRSAEQGLEKWESLATAPLLDELKADHAAAASRVEKAKTNSAAKVLGAAVSKVAPDGSSADVLVVVQVSIMDAKGASTSKQIRERLTVTQTATGWKISAMQVVEPAA